MRYIKNTLLTLLSAASFALGFSITNAYAGEAIYVESTNTMVVAGSTNAKLAFTTMNVIREHGDDITKVVMYGEGGAVSHMITIMEAMKKLNVPISIPNGKLCVSACALAALSSNKLDIHGVMLLHMGYYPRYPAGVGLHDILREGQLMAAIMYRTTQSVGLKHSFLEKLIENTGPSKWYFVTNYNQMKSCKVKNNTVEDYFSLCHITSPILTTKDTMKLLGVK